MSFEQLKQLTQTIKKLVELGEDRDEMRYWLDIFPDLSKDTQKELLASFKEELEKLAALA